MRRRWGVFGLAWVLLTLVSIAWSLATPISGAPDEPAHLVKAASVVRGQFIGQTTSKGQLVHVPEYIAYSNAQTCYAFKPNRTADCQKPDKVPPTQETEAVTSAGLYNPLYYILVGWPSLIFGNDAGIYAMRFVSAILASLFLALSALMIMTWKRPTLPLLGLTVAITPMVLFLNGVLNPNSLETAATLTAFIAALSLIIEPSRRFVPFRSIVLAASVVCAANARGLSPLWLAIVLVGALLFLKRGQVGSLMRVSWIRWSVIVSIAGVAAALAWTLSTNSLGAGVSSDTPVTNYPGVGANPIVGFVYTLMATVGYAAGMIGEFGWLDTMALPEVFFAWSLLSGILLFAGIVVLRGRRTLVFWYLVCATVLVPAAIQGLYVTKGGYIWQGRYTLPLFVCLLVGTGIMLSKNSDMITGRNRNRAIITMLVVWSAAQFSSFAVALRRYSVGSAGTWKQMLVQPDWQPPVGVVVILAGALVCSAAIACAVYVAVRAPKRDDVTDSHSFADDVEPRSDVSRAQQPAPR